MYLKSDFSEFYRVRVGIRIGADFFLFPVCELDISIAFYIQFRIFLKKEESLLFATQEQNMLKAPQITYLDYKANGDHYDTALTKVSKTIHV